MSMTILTRVIAYSQQCYIISHRYVALFFMHIVLCSIFMIVIVLTFKWFNKGRSVFVSIGYSFKL